MEVLLTGCYLRGMKLPDALPLRQPSACRRRQKGTLRRVEGNAHIVLTEGQLPHRLRLGKQGILSGLPGIGWQAQAVLRMEGRRG